MTQLRRYFSLAAPFAVLSLLSACATAPTSGPAPIAKTKLAPAAPVYVLGDFLGAPPAKVDAMLGAPALTRREGTGEYRRYALKNCTLIIILYPDETGAPKVAHVDTSAPNSGTEKPDLNACLAAG